MRHFNFCVALSAMFLASIQMSAAAETLSVDSYGCPIVESSVLEAGRPYLIEVSGVRVFDTYDGREADAEWSTRVPGGPWVENPDNPLHPDSLDMTIDGAVVDWWGTEDGVTFAPHVFSRSHVYRHQLVGEGKPIALQLWDNPGTSSAYDNIGTLQVQIIPEPSTLVLLSMGAFAFVAYGWRKRRRH